MEKNYISPNKNELTQINVSDIDFPLPDLPIINTGIAIISSPIWNNLPQNQYLTVPSSFF